MDSNSFNTKVKAGKGILCPQPSYKSIFIQRSFYSVVSCKNYKISEQNRRGTKYIPTICNVNRSFLNFIAESTNPSVYQSKPSEMLVQFATSDEKTRQKLKSVSIIKPPCVVVSKKHALAQGVSSIGTLIYLFSPPF